MKRRFFVTAAASACVATVALTLSLRPTAAVGGESGVGGVTNGLPAPDLTLVDTKGVTHALSDFAGKIVVLEWTNKDCAFVQKFYGPSVMQGWQQKATDAGVIWLTLSSSAAGQQGHMTPDEWNLHIDKTGIRSTAVLIDEDGIVGKQYAARTTPHIYVIDGAGVLRYQGAIDDTPTADPADIQGATNHLAHAVAAIQAGDPVQVTETQPYGCDVKY